jgi:hypothetical protein
LTLRISGVLWVLRQSSDRRSEDGPFIQAALYDWVMTGDDWVKRTSSPCYWSAMHIRIKRQLRIEEFSDAVPMIIASSCWNLSLA